MVRWSNPPPALFSVEGTLVKKNNETLKLHMHARSLLDGCFAEGGAHYGRHACGAVRKCTQRSSRALTHAVVRRARAMHDDPPRKEHETTSVDFACGASLYDRSTMDARRRAAGSDIWPRYGVLLALAGVVAHIISPAE